MTYLTILTEDMKSHQRNGLDVVAPLHLAVGQTPHFIAELVKYMYSVQNVSEVFNIISDGF